jgi:hypothetical protein
MNLALVGNADLRCAIQLNLVSFPSQIPGLMRGEEAYGRLVQLYFILGWSPTGLCERYRLNKSTVWRLISDWKNRAVAAGYIQAIDQEALAALIPEEEIRRAEAFRHPETDSFSPFLKSVGEMALQPRRAASGHVRL